MPEVANPIDTNYFERKPCSVLKDSQLQELSIQTGPNPKDTESGPGCEWGDLYDDEITIEGAFITKGRGSSVAGMYENYKAGGYEYFEPVEIRGYPAAFNGLSEDRDSGGCGISVGVRNDLLYVVSIRLDSDNQNYSEPCSVLREFSNMAVKTMTQGGS